MPFSSFGLESALWGVLINLGARGSGSTGGLAPSTCWATQPSRAGLCFLCGWSQALCGHCKLRATTSANLSPSSPQRVESHPSLGHSTLLPWGDISSGLATHPVSTVALGPHPSVTGPGRKFSPSAPQGKASVGCARVPRWPLLSLQRQAEPCPDSPVCSQPCNLVLCPLPAPNPQPACSTACCYCPGCPAARPSPQLFLVLFPKGQPFSVSRFIPFRGFGVVFLSTKF